MESYEQFINIDNTQYRIVDSHQNLKAEDSFSKNKLERYSGNGEAKKYVGQLAQAQRLSEFFDYSGWGKQVRTGDTPIVSSRNNFISSNCFFSKSNFLKYLEDAKEEFKQMEQIYRKDISKKYDGLVSQINRLNEVNSFSLYEVSHSNESGNRAYVRSDDEVWTLWREIILPEISYLSILKLKKTNSSDETFYYYFKIFFDYDSLEQVHPSSIIANDKTIIEPASPEIWKLEKQNPNRNTQKFREKVFDLMPQCPFTFIKDDRMLIASHIKPWNNCVKDNKAKEEGGDPYNGLTLSPSYDYLFDKGFITFMDDGTLICGTRLSGMTWSRLNISPNKKNKYRIYPEGREGYLEFHRKYIFKDNLNELI